MPLRWCPVGIYLIMLRAYGLAFAPFIVMVGVALSVVGALRRSWSIAVPAGVAAVGALADAVDFTGTEAGEHLQRVVHPGVPVRFGGYAFDWALLVWVLLAIAGAGAAIGLLVQLVVLAAGWPTSRPVVTRSPSAFTQGRVVGQVDQVGGKTGGQREVDQSEQRAKVPPTSWPLAWLGGRPRTEYGAGRWRK